MAGIRSALGALKDQTSISIAKVSSNLAPELDVLVVKTTSHEAEPAEERHVREIMALTSGSPVHVSACVSAISKRISRTRDWVVALKALSLIHRLLADGSATFRQEILYATRRGTRLLNLSDFRDEAHSSSWDHSAFVRTYSLFLDQRLECYLYDSKTSNNNNNRARSPRDRDSWHDPASSGDPYRSPLDERRSNGAQQTLTPVRDMKPEQVIGRMHQLQQLLDRFLACRPTGTAKYNRLILVSLYPVVKESFQIYSDICEVLAVLLDRFFDMEYRDCTKAFECYASAAKQIDELSSCYAWCKDVGIARANEYPEVQKITDKLLETLEEFLRDRAKRAKSPVREPKPIPVKLEASKEPDMNEIKALPAPEDFKPEFEPVMTEPEPVKAEPEPVTAPVVQPALVDLREDNTTPDEQGNKLALALFSGTDANTGTNSGTGNPWEPFQSGAESDWESALVETASNLSNQKNVMGGGLDPLLLNGMYDQGLVRNHVTTQTGSVGSASSVALPVAGQNGKMLALPAPDGSVQVVGGDPFAASLSVPPPAYVQMKEMENKQQMLVQEQMMWQQYQQSRMQGVVQSNNQNMPYGMPYNNTGGFYRQGY